MNSDFNAIKKRCRAKGIALALVDIPTIGEMFNRYGSGAYRDLLSQWEYAYANTRKIPKRRIDFLSGRIAGKHAVSEYMNITNKTKESSPGFNDIEIRKTDTGAPEVRIMNRESELLISISHSGRCAVSMVTGAMNYRGIGIDVERIEKRDNSFLDIAFSGDEIAKLQRECKNPSKGSEVRIDEEITRYWTMKESIMKSLSIGLNVDLKDIDIVKSEGSQSHFVMRNEVKEKYELLGATDIGVDTFKINRYIISISYIH
jgi:phosphopantetheine--protein transferase-like protein